MHRDGGKRRKGQGQRRPEVIGAERGRRRGRRGRGPRQPAPPAQAHILSETAASGEADEHTRKRGQTRGGPRGGGGEGVRHAVAREAREMGEELVARRRDGAKGRDGKVAEAEVGREGRRVDTVLVTTRRPDGSIVSSKADAVGMVRLQVGGGGHIERLDLNAGPDARRIQAKDNHIRSVEEARARAVHPRTHAMPRVALRPAKVRDDAVGAEDSLQNGGQGTDDRVVDGARKAGAIATDGMVARPKGGEGAVRHVPSAGGARDGPIRRRIGGGGDEE